MDEKSKCHESYWVVSSFTAVYCAECTGGSKVWVWVKSSIVTVQMKATEQFIPLVLFILLCKAVLTFKSMGEIVKCYHSSVSYWAVLSCGAAYYVVLGGSSFCVCKGNPKVWLSNENYWAVLSCGAVYYAECIDSSNFRFCGNEGYFR